MHFAVSGFYATIFDLFAGSRHYTSNNDGRNHIFSLLFIFCGCSKSCMDKKNPVVRGKFFDCLCACLYQKSNDIFADNLLATFAVDCVEEEHS